MASPSAAAIIMFVASCGWAIRGAEDTLEEEDDEDIAKEYFVLSRACW